MSDLQTCGRGTSILHAQHHARLSGRKVYSNPPADPVRHDGRLRHLDRRDGAPQQRRALAGSHARSDGYVDSRRYGAVGKPMARFAR